LFPFLEFPSPALRPLSRPNPVAQPPMSLQTQAKSAPAIPGLEQGNPQVSNRPQTPPPPAQPGAPAPGQPVILGPGGPRTADQIRDDIRDQIRRSIQNGGDPVINLPDRFDATNAVPRGAVQISIALFVCLAFVIVFRPIAGAIARRSDARNDALRSGGADIGAKIEQLQQSVDAMSLEVERITEAQRFQTKLLADRGKEPEHLGR
jgi:hypothetical protein